MTRRGALAAGLAAAAAYAGLAGLSGHLSPLARGPLLDGLGPGAPYRWVDPPPKLSSTNLRPSAGRFSLDLGAAGVRAKVVFTSDNQVTVLVADGAIEGRPGDRAVELRIDPVDPTTLGPPGGDLAFFGNAYRLRATSEPSGTPVALADRIQLVLVYPSTATLHSTDHELLFSPNGKNWTPLETNDSLGQQQAEAFVPDLGYVVVAGVPSAAPVSVAPGTTGNGTSTTVAVILLVVAACALLIGVGLMLRNRRT